MYRTEQGLTQQELAKRVGVGQYVITKYEKGIHQPKPETLVKIATILNITIGQLYGKKDVVASSEKDLRKNIRERELLKVFSKLKDEEQRVILKQAKGLLK